MSQKCTQLGRLREFSTTDLAKMRTRGGGGPKSRKKLRTYLMDKQEPQTTDEICTGKSLIESLRVAYCPFPGNVLS